VPANLPTLYAPVSFPPGIDETRLAVFDQDQQVAQHGWRPSDTYRPRNLGLAAARARLRAHVPLGAHRCRLPSNRPTHLLTRTTTARSLPMRAVAMPLGIAGPHPCGEVRVRP
jgi:hypothetical protein